MAPKPDQMQLEKQKTAEILRSQQAAEQTENLQQPLQQNAQTQQNAQQFWTEEMALQEQIPMQSENLSEEMKSAYENAHGQKMGVKSRIWRTERTTKKKRERSNALRAADARYAHNRQILEKKYAVTAQLEGGDEQLQSSVKAWLDLSGTKDGDAFNQTMLKNLNGKRDDQKKAIQNIKQKINGWKLEDYQNLDDRQIIDRYYDLKDKIEKAKAYRGIYDHGISIGQSNQESYEANLLAKAEYFIRLEPYIQAKHDLITSPYYSLLRKADLDVLSDEQLKQRLEQAAGGNMQSFYRAVQVLRQTGADARKLMAESAAFEEEETKKQLQEATRKEEQAKKTGRRLDEEERQREVEQYERDLKERQEEERKKDPKRAEVLDERRKLIEPARKVFRDIKMDSDRVTAIYDGLSETEKRKLDSKSRRLCGQTEPGMTDEQVRQRLKNFASDDPAVRYAEYNKVFDYMLNLDLSRFKIATDKDLLDHAAENMSIMNGFMQMKLFLDIALEDQMEISKERQEAILRKYGYFCQLHTWIERRLSLMAETEYGETLPEELPKTIEEMEALSSKREKEYREKDQPERARRWNSFTNEYITLLNLMKYTEVRQFDCTKTAQELWENYKTEEELIVWEKAERENELAQRKALIEPAREALKNAEKVKQRKNELMKSVPEYYQATAGIRERAFQSQINQTMPLEEQKQRLRNFASTDEKVRFAEYQAAIDRMMTCDLSRFKIGTDAQMLENIEENLDILNGFAQIVALAVLAIGQGMEIPKERREEIWKRYSFFIDLSGFYAGQMAVMSMDGYAQYTAGEEPKTMEETDALLSKAKTDAQKVYLAALMTKFVNVADGGSLLDRTKTVQELWDSYQAPKMHEKLADAKAR